MVMLGFLSEALGMVSHEALVETVRENGSSRFVDLNLKAVAAGAEMCIRDRCQLLPLLYPETPHQNRYCRIRHGRWICAQPCDKGYRAQCGCTCLLYTSGGAVPSESKQSLDRTSPFHAVGVSMGAQMKDCVRCYFI